MKKPMLCLLLLATFLGPVVMVEALPTAEAAREAARGDGAAALSQGEEENLSGARMDSSADARTIIVGPCSALLGRSCRGGSFTFCSNSSGQLDVLECIGGVWAWDGEQP